MLRSSHYTHRYIHKEWVQYNGESTSDRARTRPRSKTHGVVSRRGRQEVNGIKLYSFDVSLLLRLLIAEETRGDFNNFVP